MSEDEHPGGPKPSIRIATRKKRTVYHIKGKPGENVPKPKPPSEGPPPANAGIEEPQLEPMGSLPPEVESTPERDPDFIESDSLELRYRIEDE